MTLSISTTSKFKTNKANLGIRGEKAKESTECKVIYVDLFTRKRFGPKELQAKSGKYSYVGSLAAIKTK